MEVAGLPGRAGFLKLFDTDQITGAIVPVVLAFQAGHSKDYCERIISLQQH